MNDKELNNRAQIQMASAGVKISAAQSSVARHQYNSAAEWLEQAAERVKQARALIGRIGEEND